MLIINNNNNNTNWTFIPLGPKMRMQTQKRTVIAHWQDA